MVAFVASTVLTAANLNSAFNALTIRTVTGTSDTLVLADNGGAVTYSNASATTSTIPPFSSVAYAVGTKIVLANLGAGVVTVTAGAGVTVNGTSLAIAQNAGGTCLKTATNTWQFLPFGSAGAATLTSADVTSTTGSPTITTSGIYTIYQFTGSGTIVLGKAGLCDSVVVGGGGGSASTDNQTVGCGGGGAGGVLQPTSMYLPSGTSTIVVGAGGAAGPALGNNGANGTDSYLTLGTTANQVGNIIGVGGGGGGWYAVLGLRGGSGGGGFTGAGAVSLQGSAGGSGGAITVGGGGGGAGAAGSTKNAGNGVASSITGSSVTRGGGGGGGVPSGTGGTAGSGGGGAGAVNAAGNAGTVNTGGGAGGAGCNTSGAKAGAAGGSGIVIIRVVT